MTNGSAATNPLEAPYKRARRFALRAELRPAVDAAPTGAPADAYAILRERLLVAANGNPLRALVFAGCDGGEGCSRVVREFGTLLAESGHRVVIVDGRPHTGTGNGSGTGATPHRTDAARPVGNGNGAAKGSLTVVEGPERDPNPTNPLGAAEFASWLEATRRSHDYILIDAPPLLRRADATLLGRMCDGVVVVVHAGVTERDLLVSVRDQLERAGANLVGVVLNRAHAPAAAFGR
jgi:Mrp family chromosome partitioning ATPase